MKKLAALLALCGAAYAQTPPTGSYGLDLISNGGLGVSSGTNCRIINNSGVLKQSCSGAAYSNVGAVSSVSDSGVGSLTLSPTTGAVLAAINLAHGNVFTTAQSVSIANNNTPGSPTDGMIIKDPTAATISQDQDSPALHFSDNYWSSGASHTGDAQLLLKTLSSIPQLSMQNNSAILWSIDIATGNQTWHGTANANTNSITNVVDGSGAQDAATVHNITTATHTMANKTLTAPVINGLTSSGSTSIDFSGNSGTQKTTTGNQTIGGTSANTAMKGGLIEYWQTKSSSYSATSSDYGILVTSTSSARTIDFPDSSAIGTTFCVVDASGAATTTNSITVKGHSTSNVNGASGGWVMTTPYSAVCIVSDGTNYFIR